MLDHNVNFPVLLCAIVVRFVLFLLVLNVLTGLVEMPVRAFIVSQHVCDLLHAGSPSYQEALWFAPVAVLVVVAATLLLMASCYLVRRRIKTKRYPFSVEVYYRFMV